MPCPLNDLQWRRHDNAQVNEAVVFSLDVNKVNNCTVHLHKQQLNAHVLLYFMRKKATTYIAVDGSAKGLVIAVAIEAGDLNTISVILLDWFSLLTKLGLVLTVTKRGIGVVFPTQIPC